MKHTVTALILLVVGLCGCRTATTLSVAEMAEYDRRFDGPDYVRIYYMGSKRGYHYFHHATPWTFGPYKYRIPREDLQIPEEMPLTHDFGKWRRVRFEGDSVVVTRETRMRDGKSRGDLEDPPEMNK